MPRNLLTVLLAAAILTAALAGCAPSSLPSSPDTPSDTSVTDSVTEAPVTEPPETDSPVTEPPETAPPVTEYVEACLVEELSDTASAFVYDPQQGFLLCLGDPGAPLWPASTTKLVTALVALDCMSPDVVLTAGDELDFVMKGASIAWITKGQKLTVGMLIEAMLLPSGCDAAYVLAAGVGRYCFPDCADAAEAVNVFVGMMNDWSARNGLTGSHWENPDGNHSDGHYSSLIDLCRVSQLALENETVRRFCATQSDRVVYASGATNAWSNTNLLLSPESSYFNENCVGLKTGHTEEAGYCLLSAFENREQTLYVGVFGCPTTGERFRITNLLHQYYTDAVKTAA